MNPGFRGVVAFLGGALVMAGLLDDGVRQRPIVAMLVIAALMGCGFVWARRAPCARWIGRHAFGYADAVDARERAVARWAKLVDTERGVQEIERFANHG